MNYPFARALVSCAFGAVVAAPTFAADLTGTTVDINWHYPDTASTAYTQDVVVGAGPEVQCAGGTVGTGLCGGFIDAATIDIGTHDLSLTIDSGTSAWNGAAFNGYEFSGLSAGGGWTGYTLSTTFAGLDASRITFTTDAVWVNMEGITPEAGQSFDITLQSRSAVPEPTSPALMLAGLGALAVIARRRRAQR